MADGTLWGELRGRAGRRLRVVDLFCGAGGTSLGVEMGLGVSPVAAVNHWDYAIRTHSENHPATLHFREDVFNVHPWEAARGMSVDLLVGSPDCFPAGTLVLTDSGYRPIEGITPGDRVLTHTGAWQRVTGTMSCVRRLRTIRGHGHPGLRVSGEHPFYTSSRSGGAGAWTPASGIGRGDYWATPATVPALPIPWIAGRALDLDERLFWLAGRYVADGWSRQDATRSELIICCGMAKAETTRPHLQAWPRAGLRSRDGELAWSEREMGSTIQFSTSHRGLVGWLRLEFGHMAHLKQIPAWLYGAPEALRRAFVDGYLSGDGSLTGGTWTATTVSKGLAFGLRTLMAGLGAHPTVYLRSYGGEGRIEGRLVKMRDAYQVVWRAAPQRAQCYRLGAHLFSPIRENTDTGADEMVYNLSVEHDESYVVEGIVVHNCTHFSVAKGSAPRDTGRRALAEVFIRWAREIRPRVIILENVREFTGWGPLDDAGQPIPARRGEYFAAWVAALQSEGYVVEHQLLRACDYGAPTSRLRLFVVARCDGQPIRWPTPTHGGPGLPPHRAAAEVIDWSIPCPSIFDRARPLADATCRRIAEGVVRFVLRNPRPFLITNTSGHAPTALSSPVPTLTTGGQQALVIPTLALTAQGERRAGEQRAPDLAAPLPTITSGGNRFGLVSAFLARHFTGASGRALDQPVPTVTSIDHHALTAATLSRDAHPHGARVAAFLTKYYGGGDSLQGALLTDPLDTVTTRDRFGLVTVQIEGEAWVLSDIGMRMLQPRELARAQGFPDSYIFSGSKTDQIAAIGNSVVPQVMAALTRANLG